MPPKVVGKNTERAGGMLPVNAATRAAAATNKSTIRLKLEIRRLPPGLTLSEFEEVFGDEWKLGKGKVDWREYRQGKIKSPGRIPEQSRCYIHVTNEALLQQFEQRFLSLVFHDRAGTHKHNDLKHLPPTLGFAPSQRTPLNVKQRADNRQGTIDQDPEFIVFLEAETQPLGRPSLQEQQGTAKDNEPVRTTPLIEDLRERKAQKAKAVAEKAERRKLEEKNSKGGHARSGSKDDAVQKDTPKITQQKVEQAAKEAAKVLNKQVAGKQLQSVATQGAGITKAASPAKAKKAAPSPRQQNATPVPSTATGQPVSAPGSPSPAPDRKPPAQRQRGNAEGIKKMLQKDLGIRPKPAPSTPSTTPAAQSIKPAAPVAVATSTPTTPSIPTQPRHQPKPQQFPPPATKPTPTPTPTPAISTTKAYLKHANPSQGMTEMLILRSLSDFGDVLNVTIDPRKGTAIAQFRDAEGLRRALEKKRVPVAAGVVEVLEFRDGGARAVGVGGGRGRGGFRGGRGGGVGRGGVGGGVAGTMQAAPAQAVPVPTVPVPVAAMQDVPVQVAATPSSAPQPAPMPAPTG
ncbi:hypothetical protein LTR62_007617 [Meristemomyces frigidus]|uniref:UPF3 domain-containing protein n=1 Tax=Meristemomyces frigidus TaxID=1508187 RepID=A0AAN7YHR3_9PEZI|nr:hypothetical protein LTR62_007617 [Meristemomyces frigidus]